MVVVTALVVVVAPAQVFSGLLFKHLLLRQFACFAASIEGRTRLTQVRLTSDTNQKRSFNPTVFICDTTGITREGNSIAIVNRHKKRCAIFIISK